MFELWYEWAASSMEHCFDLEQLSGNLWLFRRGRHCLKNEQKEPVDKGKQVTVFVAKDNKWASRQKWEF